MRYFLIKICTLNYWMYFHNVWISHQFETWMFSVIKMWFFFWIISELMKLLTWNLQEICISQIGFWVEKMGFVSQRVLKIITEICFRGPHPTPLGVPCICGHVKKEFSSVKNGLVCICLGYFAKSIPSLKRIRRTITVSG